MKTSHWSALFALMVAAGAGAAACGEDSGSTFDGGVGGDQDGSFGDGGGVVPPIGGDGGDLFGDADVNGDLAITPANQTLDVTSGQPKPTQQYVALFNGVQIAAQWSVDRGEIGTIDAATGVFTPTGTVGGTAVVSATYRGKTATTNVTVKLHVIQVGDPEAPDAGAGGAGGFGGVGGEGEGPGATPAQKGTLDGTPTADATVSFLYPYDQTVWPRGILAPLLQWDPGAHAFDAVRIHISEASYEYTGYFQKPTSAIKFLRHPIPQAIWKQLAYSNQGEDVKVSLVFSQGASTIGPITESWKIAQGTLKGTVYYNSYGTNLAKQSGFVGKDGTPFGGATLAIRGGSTDPVLVAGDDSKCRVCHSVAAQGSTLITQHGDSYATSGAYDLIKGTAANQVETVLAKNNDGRFLYPALTPDGKMLVTSTTGSSALYSVPDGNQVTATGLPASWKAFLPAFSPDGKHVAHSDGASLGAIDFDAATTTFANGATLFTPTTGKAYWPSFLPTNDGVVFEVETVYNGRDVAGTRSRCEDPSGTNVCGNQGTHAELWWLDVKTKKATRLDKANGLGYLPSHPTAYPGDEGKDAEFNYEPTVNPVPSGGYAWVVFTSRRRYGNVATVNPFWSDPRFRVIGPNAPNPDVPGGKGVPTTKKLWVAAIDLNAPPGTDPSHPAFYLPAQELFAGNARGYWVVDPCHTDGTTCETGDECCGGFCRNTGGGLVCSTQAPGCSQEFDKCSDTQPCCQGGAPIQCINGRCAQPGPR